MNINEKQQALNAAFFKMSNEAQEVVLRYVLAMAEKHPQQQRLKLVLVKNRRFN